MHALIVIDAQNEFSAKGLREPVAWVQHFNRPTESAAFVPGSWGAELSPGLSPREGDANEERFTKDVFGAFTGTGLDEWLRARSVTQVLLVGFYTHMCVSTTAREAFVRDFRVVIDQDATGACAIEHDWLGSQSADEVRRSALLQLSNMGATIQGQESP
ncbi:MAG: isochorismatase family cysteine hydrolase [Gemmatimonadaceae bacterium]